MYMRPRYTTDLTGLFQTRGILGGTTAPQHRQPSAEPSAETISAVALTLAFCVSLEKVLWRQVRTLIIIQKRL